MTLTETLVKEEDMMWIAPALRKSGYTLHPGASSPSVGALGMRKSGVAFLVHDTVAVTPLQRTPAMEGPYREARLHYVSLSHVSGNVQIRALVFYGLSGRAEQNVAEIARIMDDLSTDRDTPTVISGDLNIPGHHGFWEDVRVQSDVA